jgi:ADP-dependent phosphofructokinase/glucokinase
MIKSLKEIYMDGIIDYPNFEKKKKKKKNPFYFYNNRDPHPIYTRNIYLFG